MRSRLSISLVMLCALNVAGCAWLQMPRIDPSGDRIFAEGPLKPRANTPYFDSPGGPLPWDDVAVRLTPQRIVEPVGTEVVLLAGVVGPDEYFRMNRRLEWSIAQGSVGNFVDVGRSGFCDLLVGDFSNPRKIDATYAIGSTSRWNLRLNRGTPSPADDVFVLAGQGWISVTSPVEGTTAVNVHAPDVYPWDKRTQSAVIHWVDAQWICPSPTIIASGSKQTLTTSVLRQTDRSPCLGWRVRYDILDGPPAGFMPDGSPSIEVVTDDAGQASAEIFQKQPAPGSNRIGIQIIRPANLPGSGGVPLVIGNGSSMVTWTAAALTIKKTGPSVGSVGAMLTYRTVVTNPGDRATPDATVTEDIPEGLSFVSSTPPATVTGQRLSWRLGMLKPNDGRTIDVNYRAERSGSVTCCASVSGGGLGAKDCVTSTVSTATTAITTPKVDLKISGPTQAKVGDQVDFEVLITSRLPQAEKLTIKDRYDAGFQNPAGRASNVIERDLGLIAPNAPQLVHIAFRVMKAGQLCHKVEIWGARDLLASQSACLTATGGPALTREPEAAGVGPGLPVTPRAGEGLLKVTKKGPGEQVVGKTVQYAIEVVNSSPTTLSNLTITDECDRELEAKEASGNPRLPNTRTLIWTIPQLRSGESKIVDVLYKCNAASLKACTRVKVTSAEGVSGGAEACLTILNVGGGTTGPLMPDRDRPAEAPAGASSGNLKVAVADMIHPILAGRTETYAITVTNEGRGIDRMVSVNVTIPVGMTPSALGTTGPPFVKVRIDRQTVHFDPVPEVRPGESLTYRVVAQTRQPGNMTVHVEASSLNQIRPVIVEKVTEVTPKP